MNNRTSDIKLATFTADVTRTVTAFVPTGERFENTVSGRVMDAGTLSFDCGHSYVWRPYGMRDSDPMPAAGAQMLCAECIQAAIDAVKAAQS